MAKREWTVGEATQHITRHGGKVTGKQIRITRPGLSVLGAIDYLVNHQKHIWIKEVK